MDMNRKTKTEYERQEKPYPRFRTFCSSALLTFCVLIMGVGFMVADYNTRRIGFGDSSLRIDVTTKDGKMIVNFLGRERAIQFSDSVQKWTGRVWNLLPPDIRTIFWIFESEREAVPYVLEWTGAG